MSTLVDQFLGASHQLNQEIPGFYLRIRPVIVDEVEGPFVFLVDLPTQPCHVGVAQDVPPQHVGVVGHQGLQVGAQDRGPTLGQSVYDLAHEAVVHRQVSLVGGVRPVRREEQPDDPPTGVLLLDDPAVTQKLVRVLAGPYLVLDDDRQFVILAQEKHVDVPPFPPDLRPVQVPQF